MREIEFRIRHRDREWFYGVPLTQIRNGAVGFKSFNNDYYDLFADAETLGQFTGLKDKNGAKVYEGDIIRILYTDWASKSENDTRTLDEYLKDIAKIGVVEWDIYYPQFHIHFMDKDNYNSLDYGRYGYIEVIGNIYDNPDLIKESESNERDE